MFGKKTVSLTGNDTLLLAGRVVTDVADKSWAELTYPNNLVEVKVGKNGNSLYALNASGLIAELTLRLVRGSSDDTYYNGLLAQQKADLSSFVLLSGQLVKRVGDGLGNVTQDVYYIDGGVFQTQVTAASNTEGDTDQSVSIYKFRFTNADRAV